MDDATGRYGGGLLVGNQHRMVDRSLCDSLDEETKEFYGNTPINIADVTKIVPYPVQNIVVKYKARILDRDHKVSSELTCSKDWSVGYTLYN